MSIIIPKDKKVLIEFIKDRYPVGSFIHDLGSRKTYKIKKTSVFEVHEWDYNEESKPEDEKDVYIDFMVRDAGKYSRVYSICSHPRSWCTKPPTLVLKDKLELQVLKYGELINIMTKAGKLSDCIQIYNACIDDLLSGVRNNQFIPNWANYEKVKLEPKHRMLESTRIATHAIGFNNLYLNATYNLYNAGLVEANNKAFILLLKDLLELRKHLRANGKSNTDLIYFIKFLLNYTFYAINVCPDSKYKIDKPHLIERYAEPYFKMLLWYIPNSIVSITTDEITIRNYDDPFVRNVIKHVLDKSGLPYEIEEIKTI